MGVALDPHQGVHLHGSRLTNSVDIVPTQIHKHNMFGDFLGIAEQLLLEGQVLHARLSPGSSSGDRVSGELSSSALHFKQALRRRSNDLKIVQINVEHVRRGVQRPQLAIHMKRMRRSLAIQPLGWDSLDYISRRNLLLQLGNHALVPRLTDIRDGFRALVVVLSEGDVADGPKAILDRVHPRYRPRVAILQQRLVHDVDQSDKVDTIAKKVIRHERVVEHPAAVRYIELVHLHLSHTIHTWLKEANGIVTDITHCPQSAEGDVADVRKDILFSICAGREGRVLHDCPVSKIPLEGNKGVFVLVRSHQCGRTTHHHITLSIHCFLYPFQEKTVGSILKSEIYFEGDIHRYDTTAGWRNGHCTIDWDLTTHHGVRTLLRSGVPPFGLL
mmetsp:Transcript_11421/g.32079  ORF Transcript_11421/g.32079 Transcript_11421/m.32079 type:complete len:387 (-) Transcript_11421:104-1264(-)